MTVMPCQPTQEHTMFLGLRTVIYPVPDLSSAKLWYERVLGIKPYFDQPYYVGFSVGGFELGLLPVGIPSTNGPQPWWGVPDAKAEFERLLSLGATEIQPVTEVGEGIKVAAVKDPFGNRVGIIENPNFKVEDVR